MQAEIVSATWLSKDIISVWVKPKGLFVKPKPGQFFGIKIPDRDDLLLRRPFSVADFQNRKLRFIFRMVGKGTKILARAQNGDRWDILGPLGKPAPISYNRDVLLCAGGVGAAPLLYLCRTLITDNRITVITGARRQEDLILVNDFKKLNVRLFITTEDGSRGKKGRVPDLLLPILNELSNPIIYACGPRPMLKKLQQLAGEIPIWGFLEERMGCGTGICYCCGIKRGDSGYLRVCKDGPVVLLNEVIL